MKRHEIFLLLSFLGSQVNIKVVANDISSKSGLFGYHTFFCYGDRNHDGKLSMDEWDHTNKAWSSEFQELYNKISASIPLKDEIEKKGHITMDEFKKMSIPGSKNMTISQV